MPSNFNNPILTGSPFFSEDNSAPYQLAKWNKKPHLASEISILDELSQVGRADIFTVDGTIPFVVLTFSKKVLWGNPTQNRKFWMRKCAILRHLWMELSHLVMVSQVTICN
jgi:hypothetical protein